MTTAIQSTKPMTSISAPDEAPAEALTGEAVLSYCSARIHSLDSLIQGRFAEQRARNQTLKQVGSLMDIMRRSGAGQAAGAKDAAGKDHAAHHEAQARDLRKLYNEASDPQLREAIAGCYQTVTGRALEAPAADGRVADALPADWLDRSNVFAQTRETWESKLGELKNIQDGVSKDNEMSMIQLQSILSQRQLAVQITTQMLSAMAEAKKGIVANIRA
jgi:hypothetical protein